MKISIYTEQLQKRLKEFNSGGEELDLAHTSKLLLYIRGLLKELKDFAAAYQFENENEEILFFKHQKPILLSQLYYYKVKLQLQIFDSLNTPEERIENYQHILGKLQRFANKNLAFYKYCLSGNTQLDKVYFTRNQQQQHLPITWDLQFSTGYDVKFAKLLNLQMISLYVREATASLKRNDNATSPKLQWTAQKVSLVELIYALHSAGVFNHGRADVKQIAQCLEGLFSIDLGNYARILSEIKIRKRGQTNFIDYLKERLQAKLE